MVGEVFEMALERGNKLWEGHRMILPQHEEQLWLERQKEKEYRPPVLAEDALEEINRLIERSYMEDQPIEVTYATLYGPRKYIGFVMRIDPVGRWLLLQNGEDKELIPFSKIIGAEEL